METNNYADSIKRAVTQQDVSSLIKNRWSARAFSEATITDDELRTLFEAASWSPSSMNEQPWVYVYAHRGSELFEQMWSCLSVGNQPWAKKAAVLLMSLCRTRFAANGQANFHALYDLGAANTTLLLQATAMDIRGHIMGGFDRDKAVELFGIGEQYTIGAFIALGYLSSPETLEEPFRTRETTPRVRHAVDAFAFSSVEQLK